jgi:hypothetical protein
VSVSYAPASLMPRRLLCPGVSYAPAYTVGKKYDKR